MNSINAHTETSYTIDIAYGKLLADYESKN